MTWMRDPRTSHHMPPVPDPIEQEDETAAAWSALYQQHPVPLSTEKDANDGDE